MNQMLIKKVLFTLLAPMGLTVHAEGYDYPYLAFQQSNGTMQTVSTESLVLTIADGKLVATNSDGTQTFTLSDLSKMYFSTTAEASSIEDTAVHTDIPVEVYTTAGIPLGRFDTLVAAKATLAKGIYIVKQQNGSTLKIAIR